jgi:SWI/SNF-related matrix-associated actin-dependent regulator of chromatin subfamily A member 5
MYIHVYLYIKTQSCAKHGRKAYAKIALDIGKTEGDVEAYSAIFWERAPHVLPSTEMENILRRVEKGERKLGEIERLTETTAKFLSLWSDPLNQISFRFVGSHGHVFGADEDRHLLFYTNLHGYGNWSKIRADIRSSEFFQFDYFLRSLSASEIGKRCETLMREASKV